MSKAQRIEAPIKGALGNEVKVGDTVMVVSTGWGNTYCKRGKYLGYIEGKGYYKQRAQVEVEETGYRRIWNDTQETADYSCQRMRDLITKPDYYKSLSELTTVLKVPYFRVTTLNLNRIATLKD
jgi:hypothetical protein